MRKNTGDDRGNFTMHLKKNITRRLGFSVSSDKSPACAVEDRQDDEHLARRLGSCQGAAASVSQKFLSEPFERKQPGHQNQTRGVNQRVSNYRCL